MLEITPRSRSQSPQRRSWSPGAIAARQPNNRAPRRRRRPLLPRRGRPLQRRRASTSPTRPVATSSWSTLKQAPSLRRIAVGKRPRGIRLSRDGKQLLVALSGSPIAGPGVDESKLPPPDRAADGIGVVDLATHKMVRTHDSGQDPESFDISPDGTKVYVSNEDAAEMSVLDLGSGKIIARVKVGEEPEAVTLRPDGRVAYVGCEGDERGRGRRHGHQQGRRADQDRRAAARHRLHVGRRDRIRRQRERRQHDVVDAAKHKAVATIKIPPTPERRPCRGRWASCISRDGTQLYVSLGRAKSIAVIDAAERKFVGPSRTSARGRGASSSALTAGRCTPPTAAPPTSRSSTWKLARSRSESRPAAVPGVSWSRLRLADDRTAVMSLLLASFSPRNASRRRAFRRRP